MPLLHDPRHRPAVERDFEQGDIADAIDETRPRNPRSALDVDPTVRGGQVEVIARLERERRGVTDQLDDDPVVLGIAVGRVLGRRVRDAVEQSLPLRIGRVQSLLELLQLRLHAA